MARPARLLLDPPPGRPLLEVLRSSGIDFVEVPGLGRDAPPTSFKQRGRSTFHVDLLAPGRGDRLAIVPVPELAAHALALPYLGWLLEESQRAAVLSRTGCCAVRVPLPERFAIHKLISSRLRPGRDAKTAKDVQQACVLSAVLAATHPGALRTAAATLPRRTRSLLAQGRGAARPHLELAEPEAWEELSGT